MNGKLFYLADRNLYVFITPMALKNSIKDTIQEDMMERLGISVAVISNCNSFKYITPVKATMGGH